MDREGSGDIIKLISEFNYLEINELLNSLISTDSIEVRDEIFEEIFDFLKSKGIDTIELRNKLK
jgi:hypothetical protein